MILYCNFEELGALKKGAEALLAEAGSGPMPVAAPPEGREEAASLLPRLTGDLTIETLAEQRRVHAAVAAIVGQLRESMDEAVVATHPGGEVAVASYFLYAHALSVLSRLEEMGQEMEALIEVVTGNRPTRAMAETFHFPS